MTDTTPRVLSLITPDLSTNAWLQLEGMNDVHEWAARQTAACLAGLTGIPATRPEARGIVRAARLRAEQPDHPGIGAVLHHDAMGGDGPLIMTLGERLVMPITNGIRLLGVDDPFLFPVIPQEDRRFWYGSILLSVWWTREGIDLVAVQA